MVTIFSRLVRNVEIFLVRASNSFLSRCSQRFCVKRRGNTNHARRSTPRETHLLCIESLSLVYQSPPPFGRVGRAGEQKLGRAERVLLKLEIKSG